MIRHRIRLRHGHNDIIEQASRKNGLTPPRPTTRDGGEQGGEIFRFVPLL